MPNRRSPRNHPESMVPRRYHLSRPPVLRPARPENGVTTSDWLWNSNTYRHVQNTRRNRRSVAAQSRRAAARAARIQAARAPKPAIGRANQHWIWNSRTLRHIRNSASNRRRVHVPPPFGAIPQRRSDAALTYTTANVPGENLFSVVLRNAAEHFWSQLSPHLRHEGFKLYFHYDFRRQWNNPDIDVADHPDFNDLQAAQLVSGEIVRLYPDQSRQYTGHRMTSLSDFRTSAEMVTIRSRSDLLALVHDFLVDRNHLEEKYDSDFRNGDEDKSSDYVRPHHITFCAYRMRFRQDEAIGDKTSWMTRGENSLLVDLPSIKGDCVLEVIRAKNKKRLWQTNDEIRTMTGLEHTKSLGLTRKDYEELEARLVIKGRGNRAKSAEGTRIGIVAFDSRVNLVRLPPWNGNEGYYCYVVERNKHALSFRDQRLAGKLMRSGISYVEAALKQADPPAVNRILANKMESKNPWNIRHEVWQRAINGILSHSHVISLDNLEEVHGVGEIVAKCIREMFKDDVGLANDAPNIPKRDYYREAYELFRECQHLLPDSEAFASEIKQRTGVDPRENILVKVAGGKMTTWMPKYMKKEMPQFTPKVKAKGLEMRCAELGIDASDKVAIRQRWKEIVDIGLKLPTLEEVTMEDQITLDLETGSVQGSISALRALGESMAGRNVDERNTKARALVFLVYAVGIRSFGAPTEILSARKFEDGGESDLRGGLIAQALKRCEAVAVKLNADVTDPKKRRTLYIQAWNGSRFDAIPFLHSIVCQGGTPTDELESNGKFISFRYGDLVFHDPCLIAMCSLSDAAEAYGSTVSKGDMPHRYLQNCISIEQLLERLHGDVQIQDLEPYMDWFGDCTNEELHTRIQGRTWEQWRDQQPVRIQFLKDVAANKTVNFQGEMTKYLRKDVDILWEVTETLMKIEAEESGADIRRQCTTGSISQHVWRHTLLKHIPKLATEWEHDLWQKTNRGGFCGAFGHFDSDRVPQKKLLIRSKGGSKLCLRAFEPEVIKVDVTSLYPATSKRVRFVTRDGLQEPLKEWYHSFPDPTNGWYDHDFGGVQMSDIQDEQLKTMYGTVEVHFDQSELGQPVLLKKLESKVHSSLTYVLTGRDWYTVPQIRQAYHYGVRIRLFKCRYTKECDEPLRAYMEHYESVKNNCDKRLKEIKKEAKDAGANPKQRHTWPEDLKREFRSVSVIRASTKLKLNGLPGRLNMKIDRSQTLVTHSVNEMLAIWCNDVQYKNAQMEAIECGQDSAFRLKFKEGSYCDHVSQFDSVPYISAYMLGYSKMLMAASFQFITKIGGTLLYTDTDSIAAKMDFLQRKLYERCFVPIKKTFGGMDIEGVYKRFLVLGPKKYCGIKANGDYEWAGNGIPAKSNTKTDILAMYQSALADGIVDVPYFSITATKDFNLEHTVEASRKLRFLSLKGRVAGDGVDKILHWWKDENEFQDHAAQVRPLGWEDFSRMDLKRTLESTSLDLKETPREVRKRLSESLGGPVTRTHLKKRRIVQEAERQHRPRSDWKAYILERVGGGDAPAETYVGVTTDIQRRLRQHNGELAGGAAATADRQWRVAASFQGFDSKHHALQFEDVFKSNPSYGLHERLKLSEDLCHQAKYHDVRMC